MIKLSNGSEFLFMASSGTLGYNGRGWRDPRYLSFTLIKRPQFLMEYCWLCLTLMKNSDLLVKVGKTVTLEKIESRPKAIYNTEDYVVNAVGLDNLGWDEYEKKYLPKIRKKHNVIFSFTGMTIKNVKDLVDKMENAKVEENFIGLEFNCSCGNVEKEWWPMDIVKVCCYVKENIELPLGLKIAYHQPEYLMAVKKTQSLIEWLGFNSIRWEKVFPHKVSPLVRKFKTRGTVSGKAIRELNKLMALEVKGAGIKTPVVASSVGWGKDFEEGYQDILEAFGWAEAVAFGSLFRRHPSWPLKMMRRWQKERGLLMERTKAPYFLRK